MKMTKNYIPESLTLKIDIENGMGQVPFPSYSLREDLFQNSIRLIGMYCEEGDLSQPHFVVSNASQHGNNRYIFCNTMLEFFNLIHFSFTGK